MADGAGTPQRLTVTSVGARGDGIAESPEGLVYLPFTAPGDVVEALVERSGRDSFGDRDKGALRGEVLEILEPGPGRQTPPCGHFGKCGGCALQHLAGEAYADWIRSRVTMALSHHGLEAAPVEEPFLTPAASRRRMALKARWGQKKGGGRLLLGFNVRTSHDLIDLQECPVSRAELVALFEPLRALLGEIMPTKGQCTLHLTVTRSGVAMLLGWAGEPDLALRERLAEFARQEGLAALWLDIEGDLEPIAEPARPVIEVAGAEGGGLTIALPPGAFVQATAEGEAALVGRALAAMAGTGHVADLFAGIGTFSLPLAGAARVHAVEGEKRLLDALADAANNAAGLKPVSTEHRDLFRRPLTPDDLNRFGAVLFDPPRAGAKAQAAQLANSKVPLVVAVSCNPNTFARDARLLVDGGYKIESILPVDQFLWSPHVELIAVFRR